MTQSPSISSYLSQQNPLIIDGGLATELERRGADLRSELWSARTLFENPDLIEEVHHDFLKAGADIIASASYQASVPGFVKAGFDRKNAEALIQRSVEIACRARDTFCDSSFSIGRLRPLVVASVGPYGACLADGSEYHGDYGVTRQQLVEFHRPRLELLADTPADLFAFETIPSQIEAEVLLELIEDLDGRCAWLSFSCRDNKKVSHGELFSDCCAMLDSHPQIAAIGINCTKPEFVTELLEGAGNIKTPLLAYPNSGEKWNSDSRSWSGQGSGLSLARDWIKAGASLVGGCCRVGANQISELRKMLVEETG